ncbi:hypothetical protein ABZ714_30840 [Streptomyces sp. NPDC006798]
MADIELTDELIELETRAWTEIREQRLTVATATAVQAAITTHAASAGISRYELEMALKARVRHAAEASGA